jgi:hypothetical protein
MDVSFVDSYLIFASILIHHTFYLLTKLTFANKWSDIFQSTPQRWPALIKSYNINEILQWWILQYIISIIITSWYKSMDGDDTFDRNILWMVTKNSFFFFVCDYYFLLLYIYIHILYAYLKNLNPKPLTHFHRDYTLFVFFILPFHSFQSFSFFYFLSSFS